VAIRRWRLMPWWRHSGPILSACRDALPGDGSLEQICEPKPPCGHNWQPRPARRAGGRGRTAAPATQLLHLLRAVGVTTSGSLIVSHHGPSHGSALVYGLRLSYGF
jgi:hypothetical protein